MNFREEECEICGKTMFVMDLTETPTGWRCYRDCKPVDLKTFVGFQVNDDGPPTSNRTTPTFGVQGTARPPVALHPLEAEFGFDRPEDGSEQRYHARRQREASWTKHTFWWFVHNAIAHPIIGFVPCRATFTFHDYTSRRMHQA